MPRKPETRESMQPGLFDQVLPDIERPTDRRQQLAPLFETLMMEIAAALATQQVGDEQDHR